MPEIAFVIPTFNAGGAERALLNWLRHWPADQILRPVVIVRRRVGPLLAQIPEHIPVLDLEINGNGLRHSALFAVRLARVIARRRPTIVVALLCVPSAALAARLASRGVKIVASLQNPIAGSESGFVRNQSRGPWVLPVCRWTFRACDQFWAIAPGLAKEAIETFQAPEKRTVLLPNSVDIELIDSKKAEAVIHPAFANPEVPVILTACRLVWQKRVDILLEAFARLCQRHPANLVILGDGQLRAELEAHARTLGIANRTYFLGVSDNPWRFIARASVFVLSSDFEGLGNVLVEAMACGAPVVATRARPGAEFVITHESNGLLARTGDPIALEAGIRRMLEEPSLRERCIANGLRRAAEFDIGKTMAQMKLYIEALLRPKYESPRVAAL